MISAASFDRSFNQSASEGAEKFKKDTGVAFREFEITNAAQREQAMAQLAKRGAMHHRRRGLHPGLSGGEGRQAVPDVKFTIIDAVVDLPNVQSINFASRRSSFLAAWPAALVSKTGKVGFVGGMDIPLDPEVCARLHRGREIREPLRRRCFKT